VKSQGRAATWGFRLGAAGGQPGCLGGSVAQTFLCEGAETDYVHISFYAKLQQRDGEVTQLRVGSVDDLSHIPVPEIPASSDFKKYDFSIQGCGITKWVEFGIVEARGGPGDPEPTPLIQSTLYIDDVTCECTKTPQNSWDEWSAMVIFPGLPGPPQPGDEWRYPDAYFRRGKVKTSGILGLADAVAILNYLFLNEGTSPCLEAADANDDGEVDLMDPITILFFLYVTGVKIPAPGPVTCGLDPTPDTLPCASPPPCP
jgi:hypothetical protein